MKVVVIYDAGSEDWSGCWPAGGTSALRTRVVKRNRERGSRPYKLWITPARGTPMVSAR